MLAKERHEQILFELRRRGGVRVTELAARLGVSDMTIRRDLDALQVDGLVEKVHGGAVLPGHTADEPGFEEKRTREQREKAAIARAAARYVTPGCSIALSAGTTTWHLAQLLGGIPGLTVVTNSTNVALELHRGGGAQIILTGGVFRTPSDALVGPLADHAVRALHVDLLFLGVHGIDPEAGLTTPNVAEAETNRMMMSHARKVVVVADHTKWRNVGLCSICPLDIVDVLVMDDGIEDDARSIIEERVGELVVAEREPV